VKADDPSSDLPEGRLHKVADGVHAWIQPDGTWWINNAGAVELEDSTLLIDTCATEKRTRGLLDAVANATNGKPLQYAVNTHHHGDHTFGNSLLPRHVQLIGHRNMQDALQADTTLEAFPPFWAPTPEFGNLTRRLPNIVIDGSLTIESRPRVELLHPGYPAHTNGDLVAWLPEQRVLFTGDLLFPGHTPMVLAGAPTGARNALDWMTNLEPEIVIPGHGPILDKTAYADTVAEHRAYYDFIVDTATRGHAEGLTPLQMAEKADLSAFDHLLDPERLVLNLHSARAELGGPPVDRATALADAVIFHGAPIPTRV
jgi:cyclase